MFKTIKQKTIPSALLGVLVFAFAALLCIYPGVALEGVKKGLTSCAQVIVPSLFPFMFACDLLLSCWFKVFRRNRVPAIPAMLFGLTGGFVMGAKVIRDLKDSGRISGEKASTLLCGCVNAGPAFLISAVGGGMFSSTDAGTAMFISLSLSSVTCLLMFRSDNEPSENKPIERSPSIIDSMSSAVSATLSICAYVVFFSCFGSYMSFFFSDLHMSAEMQKLLAYLLGAVTEVTNGCVNAAALDSVYSGLCCSTAAVSICGLSIIFQISSIVSKSGISLKPFLLSRLIHLPLSLFLFSSMLRLFPGVVLAFSAQAPAFRAFSVNPIFSLSLFALAVVIVAGKKVVGFFTMERKEDIIRSTK